MQLVRAVARVAHDRGAAVLTVNHSARDDGANGAKAALGPTWASAPSMRLLCSRLGAGIFDAQLVRAADQPTGSRAQFGIHEGGVR